MKREDFKRVKLTKGSDGFWRDDQGVVYALEDSRWSKDDTVRAGVGWFSLNESDPWTDPARGHDFAFSSPVYQASHGRSEADEKLAEDLKTVSQGRSRFRRWVAGPVGWLVHKVSWWWWDEPSTRWK